MISFEKILVIFYVEGVKAPLPPLLQSEPPWRGNHVLNDCLPFKLSPEFCKEPNKVHIQNGQKLSMCLLITVLLAIILIKQASK